MSSFPPPVQSQPPPSAAGSESPLATELPDDGGPDWGAWMVPAAILLGLGLGVIADIVLDVIASAGGSSASNPGPALNLALNVVFDVAFVVAALYFVRSRGRPRPADFGYRRPR